MFYRFRQFWQALFPKLNVLEIESLAAFLPSQAFSLFMRQAPADQRHSYDVAQLIRSWHLPLSPQEQADLIVASLLHDCGKSLFKVKLWHRVFIVLWEVAPFPWLKTKSKNFRPFKLPLRISSQHARWGSLLAKKAGLNPEACKLIREHHCPRTPLGKLLQKADSAC